MLIVLFAPCGIVAFAAPPAGGRGEQENLAARVLILANASDPDSLRVARHYAQARGVPAANLIALPMSLEETITWREFVPTIWDPLMARLVHDHWIDAIAMDLVDPVGRRKYAASGHRIAALVVCRGVPLKIAHDPTLYADAPPFTTRAEFRTNAGSVDGELALLALPLHPINAFVLNPLFQNDHPTIFDEQQVVKVARLDGPTPEDAMALVDNALIAEREGLLGRGYVDLSDRDPIGNGWLEATARQLTELGFETAVDRGPATIPASARFDAPILYFGWYAPDVTGPFTLPGFRFPPGAIALHIHSYSAITVRSSTRGWVGPLVDRGVTATVGNVYEPYLQLTHRPNLLLRALSRGDNLVDAAYYALQALSWQEVLIGDPLYRPFAVPLSEQLNHLDRLPPDLAAYAVLRRAGQLDSIGRKAEAMTVLRSALQHRASMPVALALGGRLHRANDDAGAVAALSTVAVHPPFASDEWGLVHDFARLLADCGRPNQATQVWKLLLAEPELPREIRSSWLVEATADARAGGDAEQAEAWTREAESAGLP